MENLRKAFIMLGAAIMMNAMAGDALVEAGTKKKVKKPGKGTGGQGQEKGAEEETGQASQEGPPQARGVRARPGSTDQLTSRRQTCP